MRRLLILLLAVVTCRATTSFLDYNSDHTLNCNDINNYTQQQLWNILALHNIDRYVYLIFCPILILAELITFIIFAQNRQLRERPGDIIMGILLTSFTLNIHYFATAASIRHCLPHFRASAEGLRRVLRYQCLHLDILHTHPNLLFDIALPAHRLLAAQQPQMQAAWLPIVKKMKGIVIHMTFILVSIISTLLFWHFTSMGLNMFGACSFTITNFTMPILLGLSALVFIVLGYFSLRYFNKHMPETSGLRLKKYQEARKYSLFIFGISIIEIINAVLTFVAMANCWQSQPNPATYFVITLINIIKLFEFVFLLYVSCNSQLFRKRLRQLARKCLCVPPPRKGSLNTTQEVENAQEGDQDGQGDGQQGEGMEQEQQLQELMLLPEGFGFTTLDALRVSQVSSMVMGILLSQLEYMRKMERLQKIRANYYVEYIFSKFNSEVLADYKLSVKNCPLVNIIQTSMIIYAPQIFRDLALQDGLDDIDRSFDLQANYENMFKIVQAEGGKSGQFFFFTTDNRYILKTINNQELSLLINNLQVFYEYFISNPRSLLTKIYGLFTFRGKQMQRTYHVILMKNILGCSRQNVERLYDMKGSSHDRQVIRPNRLYKYQELRSMTLKDLDFKKLEGCLHIDSETASQIYKSLRLDSLFLKNMNLIDYSLLVAKVEWKQELPAYLSRHWHSLQRVRSTLQPNVYYHIGLIDYMQAWNMQKRGQKWWKMLLGASDVSAQQPDVYRLRFMDFVESILPDEAKLTGNPTASLG